MKQNTTDFTYNVSATLQVIYSTEQLGNEITNYKSAILVPNTSDLKTGMTIIKTKVCPL
jgi:hypothetical protein